MFVSGLGPVSVTAFSLTTMFIAVPTGVKILNWLGTMWGGRVRFTTAMLFAVALVAMFTVGGLSGVMHSIAPSDTQQTDTYFIVAHFHYVLFGGAIMGLFAGMYYWWPKIFGYKLDERSGKVHFWLNLIGFNLTFGPMHILGLQGLPRRHYVYDENTGFEFWNMAATVGSLLIGVASFWFLWVIAKSRRQWVRAGRPDVGPDPWDARTLEWTVPSPTPPHNFDVDPTVEHLDDLWHRKYQRDDDGRLVRVATGAELAQTGDGDPHLPSPSYWPLVLAVGLPFIAAGLIYHLAFAAIGAVLVGGAMYAWGIEPSTAPDDHHGDDGDGHGDPTGPDDGHDGAVADDGRAAEEAPVG